MSDSKRWTWITMGLGALVHMLARLFDSVAGIPPCAHGWSPSAGSPVPGFPVCPCGCRGHVDAPIWAIAGPGDALGASVVALGHPCWFGAGRGGGRRRCY